ncbi:hypothetical protein P3551_21010 [Vibrio parahaemolyticus]|uniref:hypothetical protein n=1 Tax=Vibrio parahaemolyticus TaxID=670 RepID=UPI00111EC03A|nr:hypothetical protein [Vibrio parahaemolyticus]MBE3985675.1 hypothetical protein [Vibrio parahaemolyticus]MBE4286450.1 hypothetical protein [Vibrio parahaemolyticus]MDF4901762.1 hypothetical protein [Vibrio parahaemolyticus]TOH18942.1 hypothetical protein CGI90_04285 [Vibrio parahaemolyticus]HCG7330490.1 hypothetical protein [Vibrio parahaemolyticus]
MPLIGKESEMANNIMDEMEKIGLKPRDQNALSEPLWEAISAGIIKTILMNADVPVTGGSSKGTYKIT